MAEIIPPEVIRQVVARANEINETAKAQQQPPPPISPNVAAAINAATAGLPVVAGAGQLAVGGGLLAGALAMLASAPRFTGSLLKLIALLWAAAYLAGAREAAEASGGQPPPWMSTLPEDPTEGWSPEDAAAALNLAQGDLATLLSSLGDWVKTMSATQVSRVGNAIRENADTDTIIHDRHRANLIAETEYARAQTMGARETYRYNGVAMVQWLHQAGACPACMANAAVSPIAVTERWPSGDVPVHPHCRCAEAPSP